MTKDLDPRMTFETFVVGPANRLAAAAARRAADSPGTSYNPLFLYSPSGLGKSHILSAIAHHTGKVHSEAEAVYQTMEGYLDELATALEEGDRDGLKERYADLDILLLDDVQFLSGQPEAQELLLRTLDSLNVSGSQIVLASDRPPAEINGLDDRLLSRFSGGLIVDIGPPEYETRVAIVRRKVEERDATLEGGVAEAIARHPFKNVRELAGALNRVLATQDLEERRVTADEVPELVGVTRSGRSRGPADEFGEFVSEVSTDLESTVAEKEAPWRVLLRETAEAAETEGFHTDRLRRLLQEEEEPPDVEETVDRFRTAVERLRQIEKELRAVGNPWPDAAPGVLKDPERLEEAEALLASARERTRPFPGVPDGPVLDELSDRFPPLAVKAALQLVERGMPEYNPLFVWDRTGRAARELLEATARSFERTQDGEGRVALTSAAAFAEEFIEALSAGVAGAWRERWWDVDLLLVHGLEELSETERAQDEFFHLFEALKRREARIMLAADRAPTGIRDVDDRLRSRFEGGLVLELDEEEGAALAHGGAEVASEDAAAPSDREAAPSERDAARSEGEATGPEDQAATATDGAAPAGEETGRAEDEPVRSEEESPAGEDGPPEETVPDGDEDRARSAEEAAAAPSESDADLLDLEGDEWLAELESAEAEGRVTEDPAAEAGGRVADAEERTAPGEERTADEAEEPAPEAAGADAPGAAERSPSSAFSPEKVIWEWLRLDDRIVES